MFLLLINLAILVAAAAIVCVMVQGEQVKVSYTHQIRRVANSLLSFAASPEDSKKQTSLVMWIGGAIVILLLMTELVGVVAAIFTGAIIGNWVTKEPVAPNVSPSPTASN